MTMQEAINHAKEVAEEKYKEGFLCYANSGDVENDKKNDECVKCAKEHEQLAEWLEELQQYHAIGTVEECREAKEKQRGKKAEHITYMTTLGMINGACPVCGETAHIDRVCKSDNSYCANCGQKLDWSDTP